MANAPFPIQPELTAIALAYSNEEFIADSVLPRKPVGKQEYKYLLFNKAERFTIPDTKVGRTSQPNEVEFGSTEVTSMTNDFGLDDPIPLADVENAPPNYNPAEEAVAGITELILLAREKRAADLVFTAANYPSGNKTTLSSTGQWSHADSNPISAITTALDGVIMRPNTMVIGRAAFTKLVQHAKIVQAVHGNEGSSGIATRQQLAELFELKNIFIGQSQVNTAAKGQTLSLSRLWGKHCALLYLNPIASPSRGITFGWTAQWGQRIAGTEKDSKIGLRGGIRVRVGESVDEKIVASDVGYFFENCVA
jgi:hypothetical protein